MARTRMALSIVVSPRTRSRIVSMSLWKVASDMTRSFMQRRCLLNAPRDMRTRRIVQRASRRDDGAAMTAPYFSK